MKTVAQWIKNAIDFVAHDIWRIRLEELPFGKSFLLRQVRIVVLSVREFDENKCLLRASSLTFYTLLSIVPVAAMAFGIAKGFGFEKMLEKQILENFPGQQEIATNVISFAQSMLETTRGGFIAGIGLVVLFWSVIKVLGNIENAFNEIWEIQESRSLTRKFSDYLSIMLISPILVIVSSSVTVFIRTQIAQITEQIALLGYFSALIFAALKLLPYGLIWILFTMIYMMMPNTRVQFRSALFGGVVAGTIYQILQWGYISFQIGAARYNAIYGSFAALPLFLIWLQLSWFIVLFGAELSFASQNVNTYEFEPDSRKISLAFRRLLALQIATQIVRQLVSGKKPLTAEKISHRLKIPIRLVNSILFELVECGILNDARDENDRALAYQPGRDVNEITINFVLDAMDQKGVNNIPVDRTETHEKLAEAMEAFGEMVNQSEKNQLLKDM